MNHNLEMIMLKAGYAAPHLAGRAHTLTDLLVKECVKAIEAKRVLCGSGVPDHVILDMVIRDLQEYFGVK
jgi:hypothetical protein